MVPACGNGCDGWYKVQPHDFTRFKHRRLFATIRVVFTTALATALALTIIFAAITTITTITAFTSFIAFIAFTAFTAFNILTAFTIVATTTTGTTGTTGAFAAPTRVSMPRAVPQAATFNTPARPHGAVRTEEQRV